MRFLNPHSSEKRRVAHPQGQSWGKRVSMLGKKCATLPFVTSKTRFSVYNGELHFRLQFRLMIKGDFHMNMKKAVGLFAFLLLMAGGRVAQAQDAKTAEHRTSGQVMDRRVSGVEGEFVPAAEA